MLNSIFYKHSSSLAIFMATILTINIPSLVLANSVKIADGVTFDFKGYFKSSDGNDVSCVGRLLSRSGERTITIVRNGTDLFNVDKTYITNSSGKSYEVNEIIIGDDWSCGERENCGHKDLSLVEGVSYRCLYVFRDVSLPTTKVSLFSIASVNYNVTKFRNILVKNTGGILP